MRIGLQLTKNPEKYKQLLGLLKANLQNRIEAEFNHIPDNDILKDEISELDILVTYGISEKLFSQSNTKLKWIHFGTAGIEKSLTPTLLKSKTIITNASGVHANPVSEFVLGMMIYFHQILWACL